ncbi:MAG: hypothetical protein WC908_01360 [Candidatus Paceibacterota bacterium]
MRKITLILVISFGLAIAAFTDTIEKAFDKKWEWAILAFVILAIFIPIIAVYLRKLKNCDEKDKKNKH